MAEIKVKIKIEGLEEVQDRLQYDALMAPVITRLLRRAAITIEGEAKRLAPVDTGRLRASITSVIRFRAGPETIQEGVLVGGPVSPESARIGPAVTYGAHVEFGTRPHWPPMSALQPWASRHGFPPGSAGAFLVAKAIAQHGTRPQPYMEPAAMASVDKIQGFAEDAAQEIQEAWKRG